MYTCSGSTRRFSQQTAQSRTDGIRKGHMTYDAATKKRMMLTTAGAIKKLVRQQHITRRIFLLQRADRCHSNDPTHIQRT